MPTQRFQNPKSYNLINAWPLGIWILLRRLLLSVQFPLERETQEREMLSCCRSATHIPVGQEPSVVVEQPPAPLQHHHSARGMHWESEALSWAMLENKAWEIKGKGFFIQHHHLSNICLGSCCDEACSQFLADPRVFMSLRHMFPGFSAAVQRRRSGFCRSPV